MTSIGQRAVDAVVDRGLAPDALLRAAIRLLLRRRLVRIGATAGVERRAAAEAVLLDRLRDAPLTEAVDEANAQHYEVPTGLFELMLGPRMKYSSAWWPDGVGDLAAAEEAMLDLTSARADLRDGQDVLELGCGWGSLTLWMAERYPASTITAVSNSRTQREFIEKRAADRGLDNVRVWTRDVARFGVDDETSDVVAKGFDRVVSVEMFEHVRNHAVLLRRIAAWLRPDGALFVHVFAHREVAYPFDVGGGGDWMARHFFTGGVMPSHDLLPLLADHLALDARWAVSGRHYARTLEAWLARLDAERERAVAVLGDVAAYRRWRVFLLACAELFAFRGGDEWHVSHYRFRPSGQP